MDFDTKNAIESITSKLISNCGLAENLDEAMRQQTEELQTRRMHVQNLRTELGEAKLKIHRLTNDLETINRSKNEYEHNLNLASKNISTLESRLQEKSEMLSKLQIQNTLLETEKTSLKQMFYSAEKEKYELSHKLEDLQAIHELHATYQNDLKKTDAKMQGYLTQVQNEIKSLEEEMKKVLELKDTIKTNKILCKDLEFYKTKFEDVCKVNEVLEYQLLESNSKLNKLEQLLNDHSFLPETESSLILIQWQKSSQFYKEQFSTKDQIIDKLIEQFNQEKQANEKLIVNSTESRQRISELEDTLKQLKKETKENETQTEDVLEIKREVIEIN